jgi:hypothetical protein
VSGAYSSVTQAALAHIRDHFPKLADTADQDFRKTNSPEAERFREFRDFIFEELWLAYDALPVWVKYEVLQERRANRRKSRTPGPHLAKLQDAILEASPRTEQLLTELGRLKLLSAK